MAETLIYHITKAGKFINVLSIDEAFAKAKNEGYLWFSFCNPTREQLLNISNQFGLHDLSIEDCLDENQIPKIEDFQQNTFILFNAISYTDKILSIHEINLFIGENFLITVNRLDEATQQKFYGVDKIKSIDNRNIKHGPAYLMHVILDMIVDQKFNAFEMLEEELDKAEDELFSNQTKFKPVELQRLRRDLLSLRKSLFHEREILIKICRRDSKFIDEKAIIHYRDIYDHIAKFFELTESYRDIVTSLLEMHLSLMNNQMAIAANKTNYTVRRLTFITTIFMPLTLLAGIGGMSEWSMMTGPDNWKTSYPLFLFIMAIIGVISFFILKWLDKRNPE